jgi:hypothetical protein
MSSTLRKAIAFGPGGTISPSPGNPQSLHFQNSPGSYANLIFLQDSDTRWVRLWVDLFTLWPSEGIVDQNMLYYLDYQIALVKAAGKGCVLTLNARLPRWITGAAPPDPASDPAGDKYPRVMPHNTDLDGPWASAFGILASRYSYTGNPNRPFGGYSYVDVIEFANEPNQLWLDDSYALAGDVAGKTAVLFKRAKQIVASLGGTPVVAGPGTSDADRGNYAGILENDRDYYKFTGDVLDRLAGNGFYSVGSDTNCLWSHHNYTDICYDHGPDTNSPSVGSYFPGDSRYGRGFLRSAAVRSLLKAKGWRGYPFASTTDPKLYLTEGAVKRNVLNREWAGGASQSENDFRLTQLLLVQRNLQRLSSNQESLGAGVEMMTNYLQVTVTDAAYDGGLFDVNLAARPVYGSVWKPYPGRL